MLFNFMFVFNMFFEADLWIDNGELLSLMGLSRKQTKKLAYLHTNQLALAKTYF